MRRAQNEGSGRRYSDGLLAFLKDDPTRCWSRIGNARCLGRWHLRDAVSEAVWPIRGDNQDPVIAFPSPIEWLRGSVDGRRPAHSTFINSPARRRCSGLSRDGRSYGRISRRLQEHYRYTPQKRRLIWGAVCEIRSLSAKIDHHSADIAKTDHSWIETAKSAHPSKSSVKNNHCFAEEGQRNEVP